MTVKKVIFMVMLMLLVLFSFSREPGMELKDHTFHKDIPVKAGERLDVDLKTGGTIHIKGWEKDQVQVTLTKETTKTDFKKMDIEAGKTPNGAEIRTRYLGKKGQGNISAEIRVPRRFDLRLRTLGGAITIDDVQGKIEGKTHGGPLTLSHLKGHVDLKTLGGEINLTDSDVDGRLRTLGGGVLLENVVGDVIGDSMGGSVIYKNVTPRSGGGNGQVVRMTTMGGAVNLSEAPHGADLETKGGNIHVKRAGAFVRALTMGGDIVVDDVDGRVNARTMGGNIRVTMTGDPAKGKRDVQLSSKGGAVTLTVPPGLSMDIHLEVKGVGNDQKTPIESDFPITITNDGDRVTGTGKINGGKHRIQIKTYSGPIKLKKTVEK